ncbi:MAG: Holliday junction branch migration DNA helicase RuvB [Planctomycetota bacterium]
MDFEASIRPRSFKEFIGQKQSAENLKVYVAAAKKRKEPLDHVLLSGPPGLGKTTLATIISNELGAEIKSSSGPVMERPGDLAGILTSLQKGDVIFIDEIHRMPKIVEEYLYSAMEDYEINIVLDQGPSARSIKIPLQHFTLIGATTREGLLTSAFRARFGILEKLNFYPAEEIFEIIQRSAKILSVEIDYEAAELLSQRARGTPRIANRLLHRIRDVAQVKGKGIITKEIAMLGLSMLGIDSEGLDITDRKILEVIMSHGGGPVGLKTIAVSVGEEEDTIEDVYEPYLIQQGFLQKTLRGRMASEKALSHLKTGFLKKGQSDLFR